ncbi:MAG: MlaD family protein [Thermoleophilaceae bacterium]
MRRAIRKHIRDFVAIVAIFLLALGVSGYVLSHQRFYLPNWVPLVGTDFYVVHAEFQTAQAVVPGQGQTVNIAGVPIGEIGNVELKNGVANVELKIKRKYAPLYRDAHMLLRPKTGLKDMFISATRGHPAAGRLPAGGTIPVSNTLPDVNLDEILANLDADTRSYLAVLLDAGGEAFGSKGYNAELRQTFKRFLPTNRDAAKFTGLVSQRRSNVRRVIHNFQLLTTELAKRDKQLTQLVDSSNANFQAIGSQDQNIQEALRLLPPTLTTAQGALTKANRLATDLGPALQALRPGARALAPALRASRPFLRGTTPVIQNQLRPFAREAQPPVKQLRRAASGLSAATPGLVTTAQFLNKVVNALAYNPTGPEEGFLYWLAWGNHVGASIFTSQDADGPIRRGIFLTDCTSLTVLQRIGATNPNLQVLIDMLNAPSPQQACGAAAPLLGGAAKAGGK